MMRARRALLYMPADDRRKIEKAAGLALDAICLDLEDGVALDQKETARQSMQAALQELDFGAKEVLVRINPVGSGLEQADLEAALAAGPDGLVLPKATSRDDLARVNADIQARGREGMALLAQIESAKGLVNIAEIASADGALQALIFGAEDYSADVGAKRSREAEEVLFARSLTVAHAAANGLQAIDMLWADFKDPEGLEALAQQGAGLGFDGMQIIHPDQIDAVQRAFSPTDKEVEQARRVLEAYQQARSEGKGAFALDGKMVDAPMIRAAERVLARAQIS